MDDKSIKGPREYRVPEGDNRERLCCPDCGYIVYDNPKVVVGAVAEDPLGRILLCRRAIEPRLNYWTIPAGYLELGESAEDGAKREALEESGAELELLNLHAVYSISKVSQIQLIYRARVLNPDTIKAGQESLEIKLFNLEEIPWEDLAFPTVHWALRYFERNRTNPNCLPERKNR